MTVRWKTPAPLFLLLAASALVGAALWRDRPPKFLPIEALTGFQDADSPLLLPADGHPRPRLYTPPAWRFAEIPPALRFDAPAATESGDPVHAAGDGLVVFTGLSKDGPGRRVILAHRNRDGRLLRSSYEPLDRVDVAVGTLVARDRRIGITAAEPLGFRLSRDETPIDLPTADSSADPFPSPLAIVLNPEDEPWTHLEIQGADRLGEILEK